MVHVICVILALAFTWRVALWSFGSGVMAAIGALAVLGAVLESLLPVHYRLTAKIVSSRCGWQWRTLPWSAVKTVTRGPDGVHVSPLTRRSPLWKVRGITLRFADNGPEVLEEVRRRRAEAASTPARIGEGAS